MREEVFTEHVRERRANATAADVREIDQDFLNALPPHIREDIMNEQRMARAGRVRLGTALGIDAWPLDDALQDDARAPPPRTAPPKKTFATPLVDRAGVAALVRLLFVPAPINQREGLYKALVAVCHNKQTRAEAANMLVAVLCDALGSQRALERCFLQVCMRCVSGAGAGDVSRQLPLGATPVAIGIQVLEAVLTLLENLPPLRVYMLTEHENVYIARKLASKSLGTAVSGGMLPPSGVGLEDRYPINLLLRLLENPLLSGEFFFVDLLASVVHYATLPLLVLRDPTRKQVPALFGTRFIPDRNLRLVTRILASGECLNTTFKRTMSALQHLLMLRGASQVLTMELAAHANALGARIVQELQTVEAELVAGTADEQATRHMAEFTAPSSNQAKLLRVLTALDYMHGAHPEASEEGDWEQMCLQLHLGELWEALSACLTQLEVHAPVAHTVTALLPLIEALMVVCKHSHVREVPLKETAKYSARRTDLSTEPVERLFFAFTDQHKKILNHMVRGNANLMSGPFSMLVRNPRVLEFDNKRNYFERQLHDARGPAPKLAFMVSREQVFLDSYRALFFKGAAEFKAAQLEVTFRGEMGVDAGGVTREWYQVLLRQMFNPDYALFAPVASDENTYHPNRTSHVNPEHLSFFKFVGRIIGKSIYDGCLMDCHFSRAVYKKILDRAVLLKDMETLDLDYYKLLTWMLENDITDIITEDFSVQADDYGELKTIDLVPNGRQVQVTEANKHEYVRLVVEYRLQKSVQDQMNNFISGFHDIIPRDLVSIFDEQELELLISGLPDIDVQDWQNNTVYQNYLPLSEQIQWFWRAVRSFDHEERAKLLQFATGTSKVPLNGFKDLRGANGVSKFHIHRDYGSTDRLPSLHTCFNQIDLPVYESYETLRGLLLLAITEGYEGFQLA
ncbi:HECT-domain-containing protein [Metschnikowia bicuspidata]|uniref:HECT-type E3 ubiquitin transferase n=1 Tax=Metschnikowia bicuspidata TaxID=27322 RepID=A0A4P9ZA40_9ASCO|nr:HECT-domain-containing protein [Metschnikowia bicuspidata]